MKSFAEWLLARPARSAIGVAVAALIWESYSQASGISSAPVALLLFAICFLAVRGKTITLLIQIWRSLNK